MAGVPALKGRGAAHNPPNRFESIHVERDAWTHAEDPAPPTRFFRDASRSIIARNESPDVGFDASINPYRGCEHGCSYCYARPTHEYLGFSAGRDFETRIMVKEDAPRLLRKALSSPRWKPQVLAMSGVTDPYQPVERRLGITRACLEVLADFRNPVSIVTKNQLVTRDIDLLERLAEHHAVHVTLSVTSLRSQVQRVMEPRTSVPSRRLRAIEALANAGIPVGVNVAPIIPGLTDHELPAILEATASAGAVRAAFILLRLPHGVEELFGVWLEQHFPDRAAKVMNRMRALHRGRAYDGRFGIRQRGLGPFSEQIQSMFDVTCRRLGLNRPDLEDLCVASFRRPGVSGQGDLFEP
jgi:DNA repair photolyase